MGVPMRALAVLGCVLAPALGGGGINPANPGLPTAKAYNTTYSGNRASALCLDCHTANPKGAGGTHFVAHYDGSAVRTVGNMAYVRTAPWSSGASYLTRYADPAPPAPGAASVTTAGQLICDSCHNVTRNVNGGNNLLEAVRTATPGASPLCEGCHSALLAGPPAHHRLSAHVVNPTQPASVRYPPTAGSEVPDLGAWNRVGCGSCHAAHGAAPQSGARVLRRGYSAVTGIPGMLGKPVNVAYYVWNSGIPGQSLNSDGIFEPGETVLWKTGNLVGGVDRQKDVDALVLPAADGLPRLLYNRDPLCDACHTFND